MGDTTAVFSKYIIRTVDGWRQYKYDYKLIVSQARRVSAVYPRVVAPVWGAARADKRRP
jgi:hypothetical protein